MLLSIVVVAVVVYVRCWWSRCVVALSLALTVILWWTKKMMMMLSLTMMLALALVLVVVMMAVLPTDCDYFAVITAAMEVGGVAIVVSAVVIDTAALVSLLLSLSVSSLFTTVVIRARSFNGYVKTKDDKGFGVWHIH